MQKGKIFLWAVSLAILAVPALAMATPFDCCGTIYQGVECVLFESVTGSVYLLDDLGDFGVGDYVHVVGTVDEECVTICQEEDGCIDVDTIEVCGVETWEGCGTIFQGVECVLFEADEGGVYLLDNLGDFGVGDYVNVEGTLDPNCVTICQEDDGCIYDVVITDCLLSVDACGTLVQGTECVLWQADNDAGLWFGDFGDYVVGDYVHIVGFADPNCVNICQEGDGCVEINIIEACDTVPFDGCGTLVQGTECVLFQADDDGGLWFGDFGDYVVGDYVHIAGLLDPDCVNICQEGDGCIDIHAITACEAEIWTGCGTIFQGVECVLFEADEGGVYLLDNLGDYGVGDTVYVEGTVDLDCVTICQEEDGCIFGVTIAECEVATEEQSWSNLKKMYR